MRHVTAVSCASGDPTADGVLRFSSTNIPGSLSPLHLPSPARLNRVGHVQRLFLSSSVLVSRLIPSANENLHDELVSSEIRSCVSGTAIVHWLVVCRLFPVVLWVESARQHPTTTGSPLIFTILLVSGWRSWSYRGRHFNLADHSGALIYRAVKNLGAFLQTNQTCRLLLYLRFKLFQIDWSFSRQPVTETKLARAQVAWVFRTNMGPKLLQLFLGGDAGEGARKRRRCSSFLDKSHAFGPVGRYGTGRHNEEFNKRI